MPSKNVVKRYSPKSYYHLYNRGVAKENIFIDVQDFKTFLSYLKLYLTPIVLNSPVSPSKQLKNFFGELSLLCYCLMPNHFHFLIFQENFTAITSFMRSLMSKYSRYFNTKYQRVGPIFQGKLKAVKITSEEQFLYLSKYIHRNPLTILPARSDLAGYKYSSYQNYLGQFNQTWINTSEILSYFSKTNPGESYKNFVEEIDESDLLRIKEIHLDLES